MDTKDNTDRVFWTPVQHALWEPETAPLDPDPMWLAVVAIDIRDSITEDNFDSAVTYMMRPEFPPIVTHMIMCDVLKKNARLSDQPAFMRWAKTLKLKAF